MALMEEVQVRQQAMVLVMQVVEVMAERLYPPPPRCLPQQLQLHRRRQLTTGMVGRPIVVLAVAAVVGLVSEQTLLLVLGLVLALTLVLALVLTLVLALVLTLV